MDLEVGTPSCCLTPPHPAGHSRSAHQDGRFASYQRRGGQDLDRFSAVMNHDSVSDEVVMRSFARNVKDLLCSYGTNTGYLVIRREEVVSEMGVPFLHVVSRMF